MVRRVPASISCVLASLLIALSTVGAANWEIMLSVDPTSEDLEGIWGTADDDIFVVGGFGTILHFDGSSWNKMESGTEERLYDVWGTAGGDVFAVGNDGVVLHYDGSDWTEMSCDTGGRTLESVWGSDSDDVYAVGYDMIMHYDGDSWGETPGAPYPYAKAVWGTAADDVHVVGYEEALLYDGSTWTETGLGISWYEQYAIWGTAAAGLYVVGKFEATYRYSGGAWSRLADIPRAEWYGLWGTSGADLFAVGKLGTIARYNGTDWSSMASGTEQELRDVWGSSGSNVYAVGENGTILRYNGTSWSHVSSGWSGGFAAVSGNADDNVYAVGVEIILYYDGASWTEDPFGVSSGGGISVWVSPEGDVFVGGHVGGQGAVHHKEGTGWTTDTVAGTNVLLWDLWGTSADDVFAVGDSGTIVHFDGGDWTAMTSGTSDSFRGVWGSASDDVFAVTLAGDVFRYDGASWTELPAGWAYPLLDVWGSAADDVFASSVCQLLRYDGASWTSEFVESRFDQFLWGVWGSAGNDVFAVGSAGYIYHFNGASSSIAPRVTSQDLVAIWGSSTGAVFAVGGTGTILFYCEDCAPAGTPAVFRVDRDGRVLADGDLHAQALAAGAADVAEWVLVSEPVHPGDVVALDTTRPGAYRLASGRCSDRVAGVISTEPGVLLGEGLEDENRAPVALVGIVPVNVTNEGGPILPGDLLVTSSTPGHAMRWSGPEPCPCALVGKALEPMNDTRGLILVLLTSH